MGKYSEVFVAFDVAKKKHAVAIATRFFRISAANIGSNRFHQNRTVSWLMSIPRSASRSSTLRSDSGYRTYIITTKRMTSVELLKYRNGLLIRPG
jgi:hypothetical protein